MITPTQAVAHAIEASKDPGSPVRQLEFKIDDAIKRASVDGRFPVTIALTGVSDMIRHMFEREYAKSGWAVRIVDDQRDGDYLEIERKAT